MSSIISDIFYNNNNNQLIDNFLLNQNINTSNTHQPNNNNNHNNNNAELNVSASNMIINNSHSNTLAIRFSIDVKCQSTSSNAQVAIRRASVYYVRVKMGVIAVEEFVQAKSNNALQADLCLDVTYQDIINHAAIAIQIGAKMPIPMACCYMPIQNIKNMLSNNVNNRIFNLNMKNLNNSNNGIKYKVKCEVDIQDMPNRSPSTLNYGQIIRNKKHDRERVYGPDSIYEYNKISGRTRKQSNIHENMNNNMNRKTAIKQPKVQRYQVQDRSSNQWSELMSRSKSGWTNNQTDNLILKFQLDNKPIKFIIRQCQLNHNNNKDEVSTTEIFKFVIANKQYAMNEQIVVNSSQVNKSGMKVAVCKEDGTELGMFSLNIVLLLGGLVQGVFPISSQDSNQCIGLVRLQSPHSSMSKLKQTITMQHKHMPQHNTHNNSSITNNPNPQPQVQGYIIQFNKVLLMKHNHKIPIQQLQSPNVIIRVGTLIVKPYKQCQIRSVYEHGGIVQMLFKQPILVTATCSMPIDGCVEVEMYLQYQLVGYTKIEIQVQKMQQQAPYIRYGSVLQNCSTNDWICNAAINYVQFVVPTDYFPEHRLSTSMKCLYDRQYSQILYRSGRTDRQQLCSQLVNRTLYKNKSIIYIQANRISNLLLSSVANNQYCYVNAHEHHREQYINTDKLLEEIRYLDSKCNGVVDSEDIACIVQYYGVDTQLCQLAKVTRVSKNQIKRENDLLYLFVLVKAKISVFIGDILQFENQDVVKQDNNQQQSNIQREHKREKQVSLQLLNQSKQALQRQPQQGLNLYHIESLMCEQMHTLMATGSIPSIKVKVLSSQFTTRPCYSCANPIVRLNKKIKEGETIIILHHNVKFGQDVEIAKFVFDPNKKIYDINGKAQVKLLTIQEK